MVEADDYLGGAPVQHRQVQGHETAKFFSYFDGGTIEYLEGGIESGFRHVKEEEAEPALFQVKGTKKKMTLTQVPLSKSSLNAGDSFILMKSKQFVWVWHGKHARPMEKVMCNQWAEHMVREIHCLFALSMPDIHTLVQSLIFPRYVLFLFTIVHSGYCNHHGSRPG